MSSINQIEIRRGTSNGTIETQIYDIGSLGGSIAAYGDMQGAELLAGTTTGEYRIKVKLRNAFNDFVWERQKIVCVEIQSNIVVPEGGIIPKSMALYDSNENLIPETVHPIFKADYTGNRAILPSQNVFQPNSIVTFICHQDNGTFGNLSYIQLTDNNVPLIDNNGALTLY